MMDLKSKPPEVRDRIILLIVILIGIILIGFWVLSLRTTARISAEEREEALKPFQEFSAHVGEGYRMSTGTE